MKNLTKKAFVVALALTGATTSHAEFITTKSETLRVWADPVTLTADSETITTITVYENDVKNYSSFNMVITVPEGITVAKVKQGRETVDDIFLTDRAASTHTIACNMLDDMRTIKIISYSLQLDEFYPDTPDGEPLDALFTLGLIAEKGMNADSYTCEISDVKFVEANTDASILPQEPVTFTIEVTSGETTGIATVEQTEYTAHTLFDLQGRRVTTPTRPGLYVMPGNKVVKRSPADSTIKWQN